MILKANFQQHGAKLKGSEYERESYQPYIHFGNQEDSGKENREKENREMGRDQKVDSKFR